MYTRCGCVRPHLLSINLDFLCMLSNEPPNNGTVANEGKKCVYMRKCLWHTNHWLWWFISLERWTFLWAAVFDWSFIILSILFINNLGLVASCCYLMFVYNMMQAIYSFGCIVWMRYLHQNGSEMFNWLKIRRRWFFGPSVMSDVDDKYINRPNEWALTHTMIAISAHWKWCPNNGTANAHKKPNCSFAKFNLSTLIELRQIYLHSNGM